MWRLKKEARAKKRKEKSRVKVNKVMMCFPLFSRKLIILSHPQKNTTPLHLQLYILPKDPKFRKNHRRKRTPTPLLAPR
jgi:hypothetical protein